MLQGNINNKKFNKYNCTIVNTIDNFEILKNKIRSQK